MVRNFGERRGRKKGKKSKGYKSPRDVKTEEVSSQELAIYVPSGAEGKGKGKVEADYRPTKQKNAYRSKRTERQQRGKKDRSKDDDWGHTEDEDEEDDLDFGGEYDEIIDTAPARREAREAREAEQMASTSVTFIDVGAMRSPRNRPDHGTSRRGRRGHVRSSGGRRARCECGGYSGGGGLVSVAEFSMIDMIMMALADRLSF